ncbi:hypothetical protein SPSINT_0530 [Staphylococcus pseudintermedius HKU10-03]|nr:hypothetical protein SPSINT_0530 [Staphylococcus pseudintermedius HKU10-03]ADX77177.1 hypothetical protein SPSE_1929 [Staphylococcus pseudintermedius ED99]ANS90254.1 hypothetical protein A6M57_9690 [Staphylococcus pseudintermedius]
MVPIHIKQRFAFEDERKAFILMLSLFSLKGKAFFIPNFLK